jgi:hypothetical protein
VDARQLAVEHQIGKRPFEATDGSGGALVTPAALGRALDGGEIAQRGRYRAVNVRGRHSNRRCRLDTSAGG